MQSAREAARAARCRNNLKQIGIALQSYHDALGSFPPGVMGKAETPPVQDNPLPGNYFAGWAWSTHILPFMEQRSIYDALNFIDMLRPLGGPLNANNNNLTVGQTLIDTYLCPSDPGPEISYIGTGGGPVPLKFAASCYVGLADSINRFHGPATPGGSDHTWRGNGMLFNAFGVRIAEVRDGTSNTLFVGEGTGNPDEPLRQLHFTWAIGPVVDMVPGINGPGSLPGGGGPYRWPTAPGGAGLSSYHPGGANVLFVDGHVTFLKETTVQVMLEALTTRKRGEVVSLDD